MPSIQKKIRDLERVLKKKGDAPDTAALQARLSELQQANLQNVQSDKDKKLSIKYHMVKFVERKKLTRKIRNVDTKLKSGLNAKDEAALQAQRQALEEDLAYVMYFPRSSKYVALFADNDDEKNTAKASVSAEASAARLAAYAARQADVASGGVDRVQHAINVEYGIETDGYDPSKAVVTRVRPAVSVTAATNGKAAKKATPPRTGTTAAAVAIPPPVPSAKVELEIFGAGDDDADSSSSGSSSSSDDDDEKLKPSKRAKTETIVAAAVAATASLAPAAPALDDFFAEEAAELPESSAPEPGKVKHDISGRYVDRGAKGGKGGGGSGGGSGDAKRGGGKKGVVGAGIGGGKPVHKQDARLQKWQADRKNRAHVPQMTVRQARDISATESSASAGGKGKSKNSADTGAGTSARGRGKDPQVGAKRGHEQMDKSNDKNDKRALWERAGGLSAGAVTEGTIQRNKGAIAKSQGKKIVFD